MLLDAARSLAPLDPALSRETYLHALDAAIVTGHSPGGGVRAVAEAARAAPAPPESPRPADLLLDGLVTTFTQGYAAGVPGLRQALDAFAHDERDAHGVNDSDNRRWLWLASRSAMSLFDDEMVHALAASHVRLAREAGALATLPAALLVQSVMLVLSGEFLPGCRADRDRGPDHGPCPCSTPSSSWPPGAVARTRPPRSTRPSSGKLPDAGAAPRTHWRSTPWRCCTTGWATTQRLRPPRRGHSSPTS